MEIRDYGTTGAKTTALGLGGAFLTHRSFADGVATVRKALDLGITYFDTSPMYCSGASQAVLGEALDGIDGDFLLATKLGYFTEPSRFHSREALITQFEENLRLLRRDQVDTLQLHEADMHHWWSDDAASSDRILSERDYSFDDAPALAALRELKASGRCRFIGISGNSADDMSRVLQNTTVDTFLLAFNYDLLRRGARQVLPIAGERGITKLIGAIFQRGLSRPQPELLDDPPNWMTADLVEGYRRVYALQKESGLSLAAIGVRYMLAQPEPDTIIIGAASPAEIEECVQAAEQGPLPEDLYREIEVLSTG
jgi:L-galactose dehydrogenase